MKRHDRKTMESNIDQSGEGINVNINAGDSRIRIGNITGGDAYSAQDGGIINNVEGDQYNIAINRITGKPIPLQLQIRPENFTGRTELIQSLKQDIQPGQSISICAMGGMGKTALANEVLHQMVDDGELLKRFPDGVIFFTFSSQPQVDSALEHIARSYGVDTQQDLQNAASQALSNKEALVFLDGCEDTDQLNLITNIINRCGLLITSRKRTDAKGKLYDLSVLSEDESITLIRKWIGNLAQNEQVTKEMCQLVGHWPIALNLIGNYLKQTNETIEDYFDWLKESPFDALHQGEEREESITLLIERTMARLSPDGVRILTIAGALAQHPFAREVAQRLLTENWNRWHRQLENVLPWLFSQNKNRQIENNKQYWRRELNGLVVYGLLLNQGEGNYRIAHPLIHRYAQDMARDVCMTRPLAIFYTNLIRKTEQEGLDKLYLLDSQRLHILAIATQCEEV